MSCMMCMFLPCLEVPGTGRRVWVSAADRSCPQVLSFPSSWIPVCAKPRGLTLAAVSGLRNAKHCLGEGCWTWQPVNKCMEDEQVHEGAEGVQVVEGFNIVCLTFETFVKAKGRRGKDWLGSGGGLGGGLILTVGWREGNRRSESPAAGQGALAPDWSTMKTEGSEGKGSSGG